MAKYSRRLSKVENYIAFSEDWKKQFSDLYKYVFFESFVARLGLPYVRD
jgi:hypothetical protein